MVNRIVLVGRLVADPEERFTNDGVAISKFRIAVDRIRRSSDGEKEADFFNIVCFRQSADFANRYLRKGSLVAVDGRCHIDNYQDRDGNRKTWVEVQAESVQNLTPRGEGDGGSRERERPERDDFADDDREPRGQRGGGRERGGRDEGERGGGRDEGERGGGGRDEGDRDGGRRQQSFRPANAGGGYEDDDSDPFAEE